MARWSIVVSDETDKNVRMRLAETGGKKGALSDLIEKAVNDYLFRQALADNRALNEDLTEQEALDLADEAVSWARAERRKKASAGNTGH